VKKISNPSLSSQASLIYRYQQFKVFCLQKPMAGGILSDLSKYFGYFFRMLDWGSPF
jgi:hypothetical protein